MEFYKHIFALVTLVALISTADGCTELSASSSTNHFDSHAGYGTSNYGSDLDECWIITASSGKKVRAWTEEEVDVDDDCNDSLTAYCGDDSNGDRIDKYCDGDDIDDITSSDREMYFKFITDDSDSENGFRVYYKAVDADECDSSCPPDECDNAVRHSGFPLWASLLIVSVILIAGGI